MRSHCRSLAVVSVISLAVGSLAATEHVGTVESGRIEGTIRLGIKRTARPLQTAAYATRQITVPGTPGPELANVLVWLRDVPWKGELPPQREEIHQRDEMFVPRVVAITVGSTVRFPNEDPFFHNVFSLSRAASFDLGRYPKGDSRSRVFTRAGIVKVFCHFHAHMSALVAVFDHPYFAQVTADGTFTLDAVPAGTYTLTAFHERAGNTDASVSVRAGQTSRLEVIVPFIDGE
jgi:plastocyanin